MKKLLAILLIVSLPVFADENDYANQVRQQEQYQQQQAQIDEQNREIQQQQEKIDQANRDGNNANPFGFNYTGR